MEALAAPVTTAEAALLTSERHQHLEVRKIHLLARLKMLSVMFKEANVELLSVQQEEKALARLL